MASQKRVGDAARQEIQQAKAAVKSQAYAGFEEQGSYLRRWLESLPVLQPEAPALQAYPANRAEQRDLDGTLEFLRIHWIANHPPASHDGAIHAELAAEPSLMDVRFHVFVWGKTSEALRVVVARVAEDGFLCWNIHPSGPPKAPRRVLASQSRRNLASSLTRLWNRLKRSIAS
jgi:hypothetical protein